MNTLLKTMALRSPQFRLIIPTAVLLLVGSFVITQLLAIRHLPIFGFVGRYTASTLLVQGDFGPRVYDYEWFSEQVEQGLMSQLKAAEVLRLSVRQVRRYRT